MRTVRDYLETESVEQIVSDKKGDKNFLRSIERGIQLFSVGHNNYKKEAFLKKLINIKHELGGVL